MNPSSEAFVDLPDGFHDKPGTPSKSEGQFSPPEARLAGEPRMQLFAPSAPAEKNDFWFWAPKNGGFSERLKKKSSRKIFLGGRKSYLAAEHHNEAAPKKEKKTRFFRLGAEKYCSLGTRRKSRFLVLGAEKKKAAEKKNWGPKKCYGGRNFSGWGARKSYLAAEDRNETAPKKKKTFFFCLGAEKYDFRPPKEQRPSNFLSRPS